MFKNKYVTYVINTPDKGFNVERRYSDFLALRQEMTRDYPGYIIPPIPIKKLTGNTEPEFIQKRKAELQMFLDSVLKHPLIKNYELFYKFVSLSGKEWEERAKLIGKILVTREVCHFETIEGQAKVLYSDRTTSYCNRLQASVKDLKELYQELKESNEAISSTYEKLSLLLTKTGLLYQKVGAIYSNLDSSICAELFMHMYDGHSKLGNVYRKLREDYLTKLVDYYSFHGNEMVAVEELLLRRKTAGEHMESLEKKLFKKKEQKFDMKNTATWELESSALANIGAIMSDKNLALQEMFPKESAELRRTKMIYGYYSNKIVEQFGKLLIRNESQYKTQFEKAVYNCIEREADLAEIWDDTLKNLKKVKLISPTDAFEEAVSVVQS